MIKKAYMIIGSSGQYEDYTDWVDSIYLDKDMAEKVTDDKNKELEANRNKYNGKPEPLSDADYGKWIEANDCHNYKVEESEIKDFYYVTRNENIDNILED